MASSQQSPYITHPNTAQEAAEFQAQLGQAQGPTTLSFPTAPGHPTPPSEKDGAQGQQKTGAANGQVQAPSTPAATPAAGAGSNSVSGIVPTLQNIGTD